MNTEDFLARLKLEAEQEIVKPKAAVEGGFVIYQSDEEAESSVTASVDTISDQSFKQFKKSSYRPPSSENHKWRQSKPKVLDEKVKEMVKEEEEVKEAAKDVAKKKKVNNDDELDEALTERLRKLMQAKPLRAELEKPKYSTQEIPKMPPIKLKPEFELELVPEQEGKVEEEESSESVPIKRSLIRHEHALNIPKLKATAASSDEESEGKLSPALDEKDSFDVSSRSLDVLFKKKKNFKGKQLELNKSVTSMQDIELGESAEAEELQDPIFTPELSPRLLVEEYRDPPAPASPFGKPAGVGNFDEDSWRPGYDSPTELEPFPSVQETSSEQNTKFSLEVSKEEEDDDLIMTAVTEETPANVNRPNLVLQPTSKRTSIFNKFSGLFRANSPITPPPNSRTPSPLPPIPLSPTRTGLTPSDRSLSLRNGPVRLLRQPSVSSMSSEKSTASQAEVDLLLARLDAANRSIECDPKAMTMKSQLSVNLGAVMNDDIYDIDWEFWGPLLNDFEGTVKKAPKIVSRRIQAGIPHQLRGICWQIMGNTKDTQLEHIYEQLKVGNSPHEKQIVADLPRTYPHHEYFQERGGQGQKELGNVARAYSLYDPEVGYCQGIGFIVGPLLMNMAPEEAFSALVKLMFDYDLRGHYTKTMAALHRRLYQFEKLVEYHVPDVAVHLKNEDIRTDMYASQWFLTFFAYKCSIDLVCRVFDIVFAEGVETLLRIGIALLKINRAQILELEFDDLIVFLKNGLFDIYKGNEGQLLQDASAIKVTTRLLRRFRQEFEADISRREHEAIMNEELRKKTKRIEAEMKQMEKQINDLNREHVDLANRLVQERVKNADLAEKNQDLVNLVEQLRAALQLERGTSEADDVWSKQHDVVERKNRELQERVTELEVQIVTARMQLCEAEAEKMNMEQKYRRILKETLN